MRISILFAAICAAAIAAPLAAQDELPRRLASQVDRLAEQAAASDRGYHIVESLTTEVGPRLAGTEAETRARAWGLRTLRDAGLRRVREEPFIIDSWRRIKERAEILSPYPQPLHITALGNSPSTPEGGVSGELVRFATLADLRDAPAGADSLAGKIVFVDEMMARSQDGSGYGEAVAKRSRAAVEAARRGALASLIRSVGTDSHRFPHTGNMRKSEDGTAPVPAAALSAPDADQLQRALARGNPVVVRVELQAEVHKDQPSGNIIGEIAGRTDEVVLIGAHLDSWDLGTGALDDGAGVGVVVAAAELMRGLGVRPLRTIRVVLFGAEEVGLHGANAYTERHRDSLARHHVGTEVDFGAGKMWRLDTRFADSALGRASTIHRAMRPLGIIPGHNNAYGGPDMTPMRNAGMPVVTLMQDGIDYFDYHHTADDTLDKIEPANLRHNVAALAAFTWIAANMEGSFRDSAADHQEAR